MKLSIVFCLGACPHAPISDSGPTSRKTFGSWDTNRGEELILSFIVASANSPIVLIIVKVCSQNFISCVCDVIMFSSNSPNCLCDLNIYSEISPKAIWKVKVLIYNSTMWLCDVKVFSSNSLSWLCDVKVCSENSTKPHIEVKVLIYNSTIGLCDVKAIHSDKLFMKNKPILNYPLSIVNYSPPEFISLHFVLIISLQWKNL